MNRLLSILLATVVLAHSLAGCCAHHAHAAQTVEVATCCEHEHEREHSEDGSGGEQSSDSCDEGSCVFLGGDSSSSIESDLAVSFDGCVTVANRIGLDRLQFAQSWLIGSHEPAPHARLHLLHQILLI